MQEAIQEFARVVDQPYASVAAAKAKTGKRVIGCFPLYVPHELVEAAGMLPVDLYAGSGELNAAATYLQQITCYPVRSALELLLSGELSAFDGAIFSTICTGASSGGEVWASLKKLPYYHQLVVPRKARGEATTSYFEYQIQRLQTSLEFFGGRTITKDALAASIKLYNRSRDLLEQLRAISSRNPDALTPQDLAVVRAAGCFMPRAEYVELLARLSATLGSVPASKTERVGLVVSGSLCDIPQFPILSLIHEAGGVVVEDDTTLGRKAVVKVAENIDPVVALAQRYVDSPPCPTKCDDTLDANFEYLRSLVESGDARGVLFLRPLYCDPAGLDYPLLSDRLNASGIPTLALDFNGREPGTGQALTRLQAFVEMLRR